MNLSFEPPRGIIANKLAPSTWKSDRFPFGEWRRRMAFPQKGTSNFHATRLSILVYLLSTSQLEQISGVNNEWRSVSILSVFDTTDDILVRLTFGFSIHKMAPEINLFTRKT
jgi:hypothetical protein